MGSKGVGPEGGSGDSKLNFTVVADRLKMEDACMFWGVSKRGWQETRRG